MQKHVLLSSFQMYVFKRKLRSYDWRDPLILLASVSDYATYPVGQLSHSFWTIYDRHSQMFLSESAVGLSWGHLDFQLTG